MISSANDAVANTVYQSGELAVGVDWAYNYYAGLGWYQDFVAGASLVKFNVSSLVGKTIESATLTLEVDRVGVGYYPRQWSIKAMATNWSAATITWNIWETTQYYIGSQITLNAPSYAGQIISVNLLSTVQSWANGTYANYGLSFSVNDYTFPYATSFDSFAFYGLEDGGQGWPRLTVTYR
jgi:hypothetical protein